MPTGGWYGERIDIAYLNGVVGRTILEPEMSAMRDNIERATWWINKAKNGTAIRPQGLQRRAFRPDHVHNPNAVTGILWDLTYFHPESITVYGADLYAAGPGNAYHDKYHRNGGDEAQGIILHRPLEQMRAHRQVYATGLIKGDERYVAAVTMSDDDYKAVIAKWQAVYDTYQAANQTIT